MIKEFETTTVRCRLLIVLYSFRLNDIYMSCPKGLVPSYVYISLGIIPFGGLVPVEGANPSISLCVYRRQIDLVSFEIELTSSN